MMQGYAMILLCSIYYVNLSILLVAFIRAPGKSIYIR